MEHVAEWLARIIKEVASKYSLPEDKTKIKEYLDDFRSEIRNNVIIAQVKKEVMEFCKKFPLYTTLDY